MWQSSRQCLLRHQPKNGLQNRRASSRATGGTEVEHKLSFDPNPIRHLGIGCRIIKHVIFSTTITKHTQEERDKAGLYNNGGWATSLIVGDTM